MNPESRYIINLEDYRVVSPDGGVKAKVFTGRDRGEDVRKASSLDNVWPSYDVIEIVIPEHIYAINPSFFEEFFVNAVTKLGRDGFLSKFVFTSKGSFNYQKPLNEAIERILRNFTAIG